MPKVIKFKSCCTDTQTDTHMQRTDWSSRTTNVVDNIQSLGCDPELTPCFSWLTGRLVDGQLSATAYACVLRTRRIAERSGGRLLTNDRSLLLSICCDTARSVSCAEWLLVMNTVCAARCIIRSRCAWHIGRSQAARNVYPLSTGLQCTARIGAGAARMYRLHWRQFRRGGKARHWPTCIMLTTINCTPAVSQVMSLMMMMMMMMKGFYKLEQNDR